MLSLLFPGEKLHIYGGVSRAEEVDGRQRGDRTLVSDSSGNILTDHSNNSKNAEEDEAWRLNHCRADADDLQAGEPEEPCVRVIGTAEHDVAMKATYLVLIIGLKPTSTKSTFSIYR